MESNYNPLVSVDNIMRIEFPRKLGDKSIMQQKCCSIKLGNKGYIIYNALGKYVEPAAE